MKVPVSRAVSFAKSAQLFVKRLVFSPRSPLYSQTLVDALLPSDFIDKAYIYLHADVRQSAMTGAQHFLMFGRKEGRNWCQKFSDTSILVNPISGVHLNRYHTENFLPATSSPLSHYVLAGRPPGDWDLAKVRKHGNDVVESLPVTAVHFHCHYLDLLDEFLSYAISVLGAETNRFVVTFSDQNLAAPLEHRLSNLAFDYTLFSVPNWGRNFGALQTLLSSEHFREINIWAHFHSKNSAHLAPDLVQTWRRFIYSSLLGPGPAGIGYQDIAIELDREHDLAIAFPDDPHEFGWGKNFAQARAIAREMSVELSDQAPKFPVGGMFVAKRDFLERLFAAAAALTSEVGEPLDADGTPWHAFERLLGAIPGHIGMRVSVNRGFDNDYVWLRDF